VIADLPYGEGCALWFDHHESSNKDVEKGILDTDAPSCARVIFDHFLSVHPEIEEHRKLVEATDKIDAAAFTKEDIEFPDAYGKLSLSLRGDDRRKDNEYRHFVINMLSFQSVEQVVEQPIVKARVEQKLAEHAEWRVRIPEYVQLKGKVILIDRTEAPEDLPRGQPFWLYLKYPGHAVYMSISSLKYEPDKLKISCGENIFERLNTVDIGKLMGRYGGGGHKVAGGCTILKKEKELVIQELLSEWNEPAQQ